MTQSHEQRPFELLKAIAERYPLNADIQSGGSLEQGEWRGIGFSLGERRLVVPMGEVAEVLYPPALTKVPGVKTWFKGVANIRGRLLTVIDLALFLGLPSQLNARDSRILVVQQGELYTGVLVDSISGMQVFDPTQHEAAGEEESMLSHYIEGCLVRDEQPWSIFSLFKLVESSQYLQVAV